MYCAFSCIKGSYGKICCTWAISVRPLFADLCPGDVLAGVPRVAPTSVETKWWSIASGLVDCGEKPERLDGYGGGAANCAGREVSSVYSGMGSPLAPACPPLCRFRLSHHRMMKNVTRIPIVVPPNAPPTIMPVLGEALLLSVLGVELDCAKEPLVRVVIPATVV